jgi:hypothetical protein
MLCCLSSQIKVSGALEQPCKPDIAAQALAAWGGRGRRAAAGLRIKRVLLKAPHTRANELRTGCR